MLWNKDIFLGKKTNKSFYCLEQQTIRGGMGSSSIFGQIFKPVIIELSLVLSSSWSSQWFQQVQAVKELIESKPASFFYIEIHNLTARWHKVIEIQEKYF